MCLGQSLTTATTMTKVGITMIKPTIWTAIPLSDPDRVRFYVLVRRRLLRQKPIRPLLAAAAAAVLTNLLVSLPLRCLNRFL